MYSLKEDKKKNAFRSKNLSRFVAMSSTDSPSSSLHEFSKDESGVFDFERESQRFERLSLSFAEIYSKIKSLQDKINGLRNNA